MNKALVKVKVTVKDLISTLDIQQMERKAVLQFSFVHWYALFSRVGHFQN